MLHGRDHGGSPNAPASCWLSLCERPFPDSIQHTTDLAHFPLHFLHHLPSDCAASTTPIPRALPCLTCPRFLSCPGATALIRCRVQAIARGQRPNRQLFLRQLPHHWSLPALFLVITTAVVRCMRIP